MLNDTSHEDTTEIVSSNAARAYGEWADPIQLAFDHGYDDARHGRSDFVRRTYRGDARLAYMRGRTAYHADRILGRATPAREEND